MRLRSLKSALFGLAALGLGAVAAAQGYTVNGDVPPPHVQAEFRNVWGIPPGDYFLRPNGDMGLVGGPVLFNYNTLATNPNRTGAPTTQPAPSPQPAPGPGTASASPIVGMVVMWQRSPSPMMPLSGGSGGDIHICPGGVFHQANMGSITAARRGAGPTSSDPIYTTTIRSNRSGMYQIRGGRVYFQSNDGETFDYALSDMLNGSWQRGRVRYAVQRNAANCL